MATGEVTPPDGYTLDQPEPKIDLSAGFVPKEKQDSGPSHPAGKVTAFDEETGLPIVKRGDKSKVGKSDATDNPKIDTRAARAADKTAAEPALKPEVAGATNAPQPVGKTDPESGRKVTQPSDNPAANQALATEAMPAYRAGLEKAIKDIPGAKLVADRPAKNPKRLAEKVNGEGQPPETVSDYGAAQISVDSPKTKDAVVAAVKKQFPIVKEDDNFDKGDKEYDYRNYSLQVQMPNKASMELQIVPKEVYDANQSEHKEYKDAREAKLDGDHSEAKEATAAARAKNDAAMAKFNERNGGKASDDGELKKGSVVKLPDGSIGKVSYFDPNMKIARVSLRDGGSRTVPRSKLTLASDTVLVKEHYRAKAAK